MGPEHVPLSCVGEVVLTSVNHCVFSKWGPNTSRYPMSVVEIWAPNTSRYPVSRKLFLQLQQVGVSEIWDPNTSHYPVSGRLFLQTSSSVFFRNGPRTRPGILCRAGCSYNCCVFEILAPNTSRSPVSGRLFLQTPISVFF